MPQNPCSKFSLRALRLFMRIFYIFIIEFVRFADHFIMWSAFLVIHEKLKHKLNKWGGRVNIFLHSQVTTMAAL